MDIAIQDPEARQVDYQRLVLLYWKLQETICPAYVDRCVLEAKGLVRIERCGRN